jgi:eukaryotic-like serine/threonine-protein kinase
LNFSSYKKTINVLTLLWQTGFLFLLFGCASSGSIDISDFFRKGKNPNWETLGGSIERSNFRDYSIQPPLELAWTFKSYTAIHDLITVSDSLVYFGTLEGKIFVLDLRNGQLRGRMKFYHPTLGGITVDHHSIFFGLSNGKNTMYSYNVFDKKYNFIRNLSAIESNPLIYDDFIYVTTQQGLIYCLNKKDGSVEWSRDLKTTCQSSPVMHLNTVYVVNDKGVIYALNRFRGYILWSLDLSEPVLATPALDKNFLYIGSLSGTFYAIDLEKGKICWKNYVTDPVIGYIYSTAGISPDKIFIGATNGYLYALNKTDGTLIWKFKTDAAISTSPLVTADYIFIGSQDSRFYAVDIATGNSTWNFKTAGRIKTNPAIYGDYILIASENKNVYALKANSVQK